MTEQLVVRLEYSAANGALTQRRVEPLLFASTNGDWHLIGWCQLRDAVRWFSLRRILGAHITKEPCSGHTVAEVGAPPPTATSARLR